MEMPIHITNIAPVDPVLKKPTRIKRRYTMHGECVRVSKVRALHCVRLESSMHRRSRGPHYVT